MTAKRTDLRGVRKAFREHLDKYHVSLGRFVSAFSMVEAALLRNLWILARLEPPYAQAVLSGVKIEGAMGFINRIAEAEQWKESKRSQWQRVFSQLGLINKLRNDLLHYGASVFGDVWVVSNQAVAHHPKRVREIHITPKLLDDASADLSFIHLELILLGGPKAGSIYGYDRRSALRDRQRSPWRYKQPPQADWARILREALPEQPPLHPPSQAKSRIRARQPRDVPARQAKS